MKKIIILIFLFMAFLLFMYVYMIPRNVYNECLNYEFEGTIVDKKNDSNNRYGQMRLSRGNKVDTNIKIPISHSEKKDVWLSVEEGDRIYKRKGDWEILVIKQRNGDSIFYDYPAF